MVTLKDIKAGLNKAEIYVEQLVSSVEERDKLVTTLKLEPSQNDNYDLINLLGRITKSLGYLKTDIQGLIDQGSESKDEIVDAYKNIERGYIETTGKLEEDAYIDIREYLLSETVFPEGKPPAKSVRFEESTFASDDARDELMGTRTYKPYRDEPASQGSEDELNHQMYARHQQMLLDQDDDLDVLHSSIKSQHQMGRNINDELDDHLIVLNDLESGVDRSQLHLGGATNRLNEFRRKCKENGSLMTIVILTVILILLLVVLN